MEKEKVEAIQASDLMKLMDVVKAAVGLYNALEHVKGFEMPVELKDLGDALHCLGLAEV